MTKKDYELIASAFKAAVIGADSHVNKEIKETELATIKFIVSILGYKLFLDNPRFHPAKFEKACGL